MNKIKLNFVGYFLVFPVLFTISSVVWRTIILNKELGMIITDALAITAIYYFIVSVLAALVYIKPSKS